MIILSDGVVHSHENMDLIQHSPHDGICRRINDYISPVTDIQRGRGQGDTRIRIEFDPERTNNVLCRFLSIRKEPEEKNRQKFSISTKNEDIPYNLRKRVRTSALRHTQTLKQAHFRPI